MSPVVLLRAFGVGAPLSLVAALLPSSARRPPAAPATCSASRAGQLFTLALLVRGVARAIPPGADESARLVARVRRVPAARAVGVRLLRVDLGGQDRRLPGEGGDVAAFYAAIAAVAWFSVIPAFAWIYVQVETAFYQRFRSFYSRAGGGRAAARAQTARGADLDRGEAHPARRGGRPGGGDGAGRSPRRRASSPSSVCHPTRRRCSAWPRWARGCRCSRCSRCCC